MFFYWPFPVKEAFTSKTFHIISFMLKDDKKSLIAVNLCAPGSSESRHLCTPLSGLTPRRIDESLPANEACGLQDLPPRMLGWL